VLTSPACCALHACCLCCVLTAAVPPPQVSYVLDTEDILIRQRKAGSRPRADMYNRIKHGRKFYDWIQTQRDRLPDPFVQQE
jgi:hypothetical protein